MYIAIAILVLTSVQGIALNNKNFEATLALHDWTNFDYYDQFQDDHGTIMQADLKNNVNSSRWNTYKPASMKARDGAKVYVPTLMTSNEQ